MEFREFENQVKESIEAALRQRGLGETQLELLVPNKPGLGDLSCAVALKLARELKRPPYEIATELAASIEPGGLIGAVSAHSSGYLNFTLNWGAFASETLQQTSGEIGSFALESRRIIIEHTNVNPNKALHIGHARNLVLGDSLVRIMKKLGNEVQTLNYIDDSGAQVADVIVGLRFLGFSDRAPPGVKFDTYCGDTVYTEVNRMYDKDPALKEKQSLVRQAIEHGEGELAEYAQRIVARILADQLKTCWRLGARYDLLNWESHILKTGMWGKIFEEMKSKGIAIFETEGKNKDCWVLRDEELGDEKVLVRSDGTAVYVAKDIPYAAWKIGLVEDPFRYEVYQTQPDKALWTTTAGEGVPEHPRFGGADSAISLIDIRQSRLQQVVSIVLERLEGADSERYIHRAYAVVALSKRAAESLGIETEKEIVHMKGRKGTYINTDTVLDSLHKKALEETIKRNPDEPSDWREEVAEKMAVAAFRFELLKQDPDKIIAFDIESSLELQGETGPYLLYSYARAKRIIEKAGLAPSINGETAARLNHPKEVELVKFLSSYDKAVMEAGEYLNPKEVARYAYKLSSLFNEFYEVVPVNAEKDVTLKAARLALVQGFSVVLKDALQLIGVETLEKV